MDSEPIYENVERRVIEDTTGRRTQNSSKNEGKDGKRRGSLCLVLMTVCLGIICVLLLIFIILQFITITAERDLVKSYKNTVEDFNQTINSLQDTCNDLKTENDQLNNNISSLNQKKLELERNVTFLSEHLKTTSNQVCFFISDELKNWSESRQFCRDRGADLIIINTEEKHRFITSFIKERVWIGLTDIENEGIMKWVDDSTLNRGFWAPGEPNNWGGDEDCVELDLRRGRVRNWNDVPCSEKFKCICENKFFPAL